MHRIAVKANTGWMETGAASKPHSPVKTTSVITRGFVSARKSRQSAVIADDVVPIIGLLAIALSRWLAAPPSERPDRKSVVKGKSVSVRVDRGVRRFEKKKRK